MLELTLTERQLIARFVDALRELPEVEADFDRWEPVGKNNDRGHDAQVDLRVAGKSFVLPAHTGAQGRHYGFLPPISVVRIYLLQDCFFERLRHILKRRSVVLNSVQTEFRRF